MTKIDNNEYKTQLYTASLMLMIASADNKIDDAEIKAIEEILIKNFHIDKKSCEKLIKESYRVIDEATDIYQIGSFINKQFSQKQKREFISSIFQIAYSDKDLHFMERHLIKKIANILNINRDEILDIKNKVIKDLL